MFGKKKSSLNFESEGYIMKNSYTTDNLVVASLEYISNDETPFHLPMFNKTTQKYIFEILNENGKVRYREVFTGFIAESEESHFFGLPYVADIVSLREILTSVADTIPKYGLLLVLDEINIKNNTKKI